MRRKELFYYLTWGSNVTRDVHWCVTVDYQQIANGNIAKQIHGFTIDYGKFILNRIIFSFHLVKRIHDPDPGWDREVRYCRLSAKVTTKSLASGTISFKCQMNQVTANLWVNFEPGKDVVFPSVKIYSKQGCCGPRRLRDSSSGNLHKTSVREKSGVVSELFDDISLMLNVTARLFKTPISANLRLNMPIRD